MVERRQQRLERRAVRARAPVAGAAVDLDLTPPFLPGSPVVDATGRAVGLVVQSCDRRAGAGPCKPRPRLATVPALRDFLRDLPADAAIPAGWIGVRGERAIGTHARGVRVVAMTPGSPAAAAGLAAGPEGDLILAVEGAPVTTPEELAHALARHAPGEKVALTVFSRGAYRQVDVVLARAPGPAAAPPPPRPGGATSPTDGAPRDFGSSR
jgi:serine protease Do